MAHGRQKLGLHIVGLFRGAAQDFAPIANEVAHLINEHIGLEVTHVVPVRRIPKTTSGKVQRHLLAKDYLDGEFDVAKLFYSRFQSVISEEMQRMAGETRSDIGSGGMATKVQAARIATHVTESPMKLQV